MVNESPLKIVIASAGRRAHYLEWFQDALRSQGLAGEVIALEFRATSPGFGIADRAVQMPAYNSAEYGDVLRAWCESERPDLLLCMNDYELQVLSDGLADELRELGCAVGALGQEAQSIVLDKYRMAQELGERGIPTPVTWLGSEAAAVAASAAEGAEFVVKHRFGSGSSGLRFASAEDLEAAVDESAVSALGEDGRPVQDGPAGVIIQEHLPGPEYGVDGVFSVDGRSELLGLVARRKEKMNGGDTDIATSVSPEPFREAVVRLGDLLNPTASIDIDFRETADGVPVIIDINPRMGGGYPFSHSAGADLPAALIRSVAGLEPDPALLDYRLGVTTVTRMAFTVISGSGAGDTASRVPVTTGQR